MSTVINRRHFLKLAGSTGAGIGMLSAMSTAAVAQTTGIASASGSEVSQAAAGTPNPSTRSSTPSGTRRRTAPGDRIGVAVLGTNSRGSALAQGFARFDGTEVRYICDPDDRAIQKGVQAVRDAGQSRDASGVRDFRTILEDNSVDALVIATPIHWHAPATLLALQAGKHVYVEKPCSYNNHEGELLMAAADKYNRVAMMGNQRRSWAMVREAMDLLADGIIGRAYFARCWYAQSRGSIGFGKEAPVPSWLDYDLWQGPAPRVPYRDNLIHYNWHWFWHWGAGELLNNGTHFVDLARWGLGVDYAERVASFGGRYHWRDDQQTPDTQAVTWYFAEGKTITWEARSCNRRGLEGSSTGVSFHGTGGTMVVDGNGYTVYDDANREVRASAASDGEIDFTGPGFDLDVDHISHFDDCVRDGKRPVTDLRDANISVHLCHLGNIAHRVQRTLRCSQFNGRIIGDEQASRYWHRSYEPGWAPGV